MSAPSPAPSRLKAWRAPAAAALLAFAAGLAGFGLAGSGDAPRGAADPLEPPPRSAPAIQRVRYLEAVVRDDPSAGAYADLAGAHLQHGREAGDGEALGRARRAADQALELDPQHAGALTEAGAIAAIGHRFPEAQRLATRARAAAPDTYRSYGVLVDALVEQGRLDEAEDALQEWIDLQPTSSGYARASYLRELRGNVRAALTAMELAAGSAAGGPAEQVATLQGLVGNLELLRGDLPGAMRAYRTALAAFPTLASAQIGLAKIDAAEGDLAAAERRLAALVKSSPGVDSALLLAEVRLARGREAEAEEAFAISAEQLVAEGDSGIDIRAEQALHEADRGDPREALALARAATRDGQGLRTPEALASAFTELGRAREGLPWARRAVALHRADPGVHLRAAVTARDAGRPALARRWLEVALRAPAMLGPWRTAQAQKIRRSLR